MRTVAGTLVIALGLLLALHMRSNAAEEGFPSKTVTLIVPYPAGGPSDFNARSLADEYTKRLHQTVLVENVVGVNGAMAVQRVLDGAADGHTLLIGSPLELIFAPLSLATVKYRPQDLRLVAVTATTPLLVLVRKEAPAAHLAEFLAWARGKTLSAANPGHGSLYHLAAIQFAQRSGLMLTHVPYKGGAQILTDLSGGHVDMAIYPLAGNVLSMIKEGRFKALGIAAAEPHPMLPDVAPISSDATFSGFNFDVWIGVQVPRSTAETVVDRIHRDIYDSIDEPAFRKQVEAHGPRIQPRRSLQELEQTYAAEIARYQALARSINLTPQ